MPLHDLLAGETADYMRSADAAMRGRSQTGFSGIHTEIDPIRGRLVPDMPVHRISPDGGYSIDPNIIRSHVPDMPNRQPFGAEELQMARTPRPEYRLYWFNDSPGRIARAKKAGYAHVMNEDTGEPEAIISDRAEGRGRKSYLMEIPMAWYQADMARQAASLSIRLNDIRHGRAGPGAEDNRYVPSRGIQITGR